ncbi:hypothetical protein I302_106501 [Kwoniella bestiolae CBS 10118]|uniref:Uncharacterized protein n=1 Tax=Kwoniella bestiolae CBS 10118 TaxID=1296100 RepID=A0A1B9G191_9TREE|nr:hypothetical protein I302_06241 [Kwoniella bestiolae CBS 10118]OCF24780.1 hypothetical protein I302_06241 [Kwoniella bestiolae CBS 10118]
MAGQARKRTAAQRREREEDQEPLTPAEILDNDGQDEQIKLLRQKNMNDNKQAHMALDIGVLTALVISTLQFFDHLSSPNPIFSILSIIQFVLLPFSLSPDHIPSRLNIKPISPETHLYSLSIHLTVSLCALFIRYHHSLPGSGVDAVSLELGEVARWIIPTLVVGAVDVQRRGERGSEERLNELEGMKYDLKGA